jgi:hypothetical protein
VLARYTLASFGGSGGIRRTSSSCCTTLSAAPRRASASASLSRTARFAGATASTSLNRSSYLLAEALSDCWASSSASAYSTCALPVVSRRSRSSIARASEGRPVSE